MRTPEDVTRTPRRVAIIGSRGYPSSYGGFETLVRHLAPYLDRRGHAVTVYGRADFSRFRTHHVDGVQVVESTGVPGQSLSTLTHGLSASVHAAFRRFDAALVLNVANGYWLPLLKAAKVPTAVNVDGIEWERGKWSRTGKATFRGGARLTARFADCIIADSEAIGDYWQRNLGRTSEFIPYGADVLNEASAQRIAAHGLSPQGYALVVARLVPENNLDLILDGFELQRAPQPLVVVGSATSTSPLETRLREMARRTNLLWLGHVSDQALLTELWQNCSIYVHGHSVGGTNPALLQALGASSPVVALDTVYNREVLRDPQHLFDHDPRALASLMDEISQDRDLQQRMSAYGQSVVAKRYRWDDVLARYAEVLEGLADR